MKRTSLMLLFVGYLSGFSQQAFTADTKLQSDTCTWWIFVPGDA
ncbi:MAG: hypothetical protein ACYTBX_02825 [Planctomycetota bacterium]|jgi:hypothetical protein